ncbi:reticulon-like protein B9 [Vigna unguiculata]|uniref:Reticulon-like protein n=1 Tax=Vigna unguiculata TaxID=3917 RepID=A0A4D6LUG7_VIGUN|nr:reticulon-like protein B9 [Vigna unguiculata]QCD92245.1 riboflavin kinase [Vigna unguiculata]
MANDTSSDSDNEIIGARVKLFGHEKPIHQLLGGGKVADMLLWRDRNLSAALLGGMTVIWFLFEIVEYNFVTLLCHISITTMLVLFIWSTAADIFKWKPPQIPNIILQESFFQELAFILHRRFNQLLPMLLHISCGIDLPIFLLNIVSLYILSVIGSYFSFVNLLYIGFLCVHTLPIVYERYEEEINNWVSDMIIVFRKNYRIFKKNYLNRIPRGPVKPKKTQ